MPSDGDQPIIGSESIREFYQLATSYWAAAALFTAVRVNLFDVIGPGGANASEVASALRLEPQWSSKLLEACASLGLLIKGDQSYSNSDLSAALLKTGSPFYQGDVIRHLADQWTRFGELDFTVKTGRSGPLTEAQHREQTEKQQQESDRIWLKAMNSIALAGQAKALCDGLDLGSRQQMLDVGCGAGAYSIALCEKYSNLRAIAFDLPEIVKIATEFINGSSAAERITTRSGSFLHENYGSGNDVVFFSGVLHGVNEIGCRRMLRRAYDSMVSGGIVVIQEMLLAEDQAGPLFPALFSLNMLAGRSYRGSEVGKWLEDSGFNSVEQRKMPDAIWLDILVIATRP